MLTFFNKPEAVMHRRNIRSTSPASSPALRMALPVCSAATALLLVGGACRAEHWMFHESYFQRHFPGTVDAADVPGNQGAFRIPTTGLYPGYSMFRGHSGFPFYESFSGFPRDRYPEFGIYGGYPYGSPYGVGGYGYGGGLGYGPGFGHGGRFGRGYGGGFRPGYGWDGYGRGGWRDRNRWDRDRWDRDGRDHDHHHDDDHHHDHDGDHDDDGRRRDRGR